ncbi:hypothetical protein C7M84_007765 [Penaeus vannamei]|uniref:Uncharacterized protein n=1 Tax=Penaeus vannamei TaxID=6689 RepID=A0A3R7ST20_PENVA|nr:hypothetical protein C7M84_007765 [Penaeus vannamei]
MADLSFRYKTFFSSPPQVGVPLSFRRQQEPGQLHLYRPFIFRGRPTNSQTRRFRTEQPLLTKAATTKDRHSSGRVGNSREECGRPSHGAGLLEWPRARRRTSLRTASPSAWKPSAACRPEGSLSSSDLFLEYLSHFALGSRPIMSDRSLPLLPPSFPLLPLLPSSPSFSPSLQVLFPPAASYPPPSSPCPLFFLLSPSSSPLSPFPFLSLLAFESPFNPASSLSPILVLSSPLLPPPPLPPLFSTHLLSSHFLLSLLCIPPLLLFLPPIPPLSPSPFSFTLPLSLLPSLPSRPNPLLLLPSPFLLLPPPPSLSPPPPPSSPHFLLPLPFFPSTSFSSPPSPSPPSPLSPLFSSSPSPPLPLPSLPSSLAPLLPLPLLIPLLPSSSLLFLWRSFLFLPQELGGAPAALQHDT